MKFYQNKRGFNRFKNESQKDYQFSKENINVPDELKNKNYNNPDVFINYMKKYILSDNIELNKFALYYLSIFINLISLLNQTNIS